MLSLVDSLYYVCSELQGNGLSGRIPDEIGDCFALKILNLERNQLSGEIPRRIYWNEVLQFLLLGDNY